MIKNKYFRYLLAFTLFAFTFYLDSIKGRYNIQLYPKLDFITNIPSRNHLYYGSTYSTYVSNPNTTTFIIYSIVYAVFFAFIIQLLYPHKLKRAFIIGYELACVVIIFVFHYSKNEQLLELIHMSQSPFALILLVGITHLAPKTT
jgi:hypothetical protein